MTGAVSGEYSGNEKTVTFTPTSKITSKAQMYVMGHYHEVHEQALIQTQGVVYDIS